MTLQIPFDAGAGWVLHRGEAGLTATWRSPQDPAGTWQLGLVSDSRRLIETSTPEAAQVIEDRQGFVTVTRRSGPAPEFEGV